MICTYYHFQPLISECLVLNFILLCQFAHLNYLSPYALLKEVNKVFF